MIEQFDDQIRQWAMHLGWPLEGLLRLIIAAIAGGLVGLERELRGRQAGFRTNLLVCLGSALVMIVSTQMAHQAWPHAPGININVDPARIAYGVMTGIGFLGAGTIVQSKGNIRGLTTAAALWCVAAVGLAAGMGMYVLTLLATLLIVAALWILDYFEGMLPKLRYRSVIIRRNWNPGCVAETVQRFKEHKLEVVDASFERCEENPKVVDINLRIAFINKDQYYSFERNIEDDPNYQLMATREL